MIEKNLQITNKLGLHARAAMKVINCAGRYQSSIELTYNNRTVNAKSILGVMALGASQGQQVILKFDGPDEEDAATAIQQLFESHFGEDT